MDGNVFNAIQQPSLYSHQPYLVLLSNFPISQIDHKCYPPVLNSAVQVLILRFCIDTSYKEWLQVYFDDPLQIFNTWNPHETHVKPIWNQFFETNFNQWNPHETLKMLQGVDLCWSIYKFLTMKPWVLCGFHMVYMGFRVGFIV